jgi:hypothetical protein
VKSRENPIPTRNHENGTWIKQSAMKEKKRKVSEKPIKDDVQQPLAQGGS